MAKGEDRDNPEGILRKYYLSQGLKPMLICRTMFTATVVTIAHNVLAHDPLRWSKPVRECRDSLWLKYTEEHLESVATCGAEKDVCKTRGFVTAPPPPPPASRHSVG